MKIPTRRQCEALFRETGMLANIVAHSRVVCRVALLITDELSAARPTLQRDLIRAAALLHDITKTRSFRTGENHAQTGGQYLVKRGFNETGSIVRQHVRLDHYDDAPQPTEAEIVNYADKRVLHDQIVSLDRRMAYIRVTYAKNDEHRRWLERLHQESARLERKLFQHLDFAPEGLDQRLCR